jgi:hypothetical protein
MKREGGHFIIHGLFVDSAVHTQIITKLEDEFMRKYFKEFKIAGGGLIKTYLGMVIDQDTETIKVYLDHNVQVQEIIANTRSQGLYQEVTSTQVQHVTF